MALISGINWLQEHRLYGKVRVYSFYTVHNVDQHTRLEFQVIFFIACSGATLNISNSKANDDEDIID
jgi:hypothetical protein